MRTSLSMITIQKWFLHLNHKVWKEPLSAMARMASLNYFPSLHLIPHPPSKSKKKEKTLEFLPNSFLWTFFFSFNTLASFENNSPIVAMRETDRMKESLKEKKKFF